MKVGFIGTGNIAGAIVGGVLLKGGCAPSDIVAYDAQPQVLEGFVQRFGVTAAPDMEALVEKSDMVVLAVKPVVYPVVLPKLGPLCAAKGTLLVSVAAGYTLEAIANGLGADVPVCRVMPNMNAAVGEAVSALCPGATATPEQVETVRQFFGHTGLVMDIEERLFGVFSAIAGCSPAFAYLYIDALAKGAHKNGMSKAQALRIAAQATLGSAKMLLESSEHPQALIDKVCSPGGVTIEGVCTLQDFRFESALVHAVDAAVEKDKKMQP